MLKIKYQKNKIKNILIEIQFCIAKCWLHFRNWTFHLKQENFNSGECRSKWVTKKKK